MRNFMYVVSASIFMFAAADCGRVKAAAFSIINEHKIRQTAITRPICKLIICKFIFSILVLHIFLLFHCVK